MRKVVPYLSFSSSCTWYISSESDIFCVYVGFVSLYSEYTSLSLYIQCIYQGYNIIHLRICEFIRWIYFVVPIQTVYINGYTNIYLPGCPFQKRSARGLSQSLRLLRVVCCHHQAQKMRRSLLLR